MAVAPAPASDKAPDTPQRCGSQTVRDRLWTPDQLRGSSADAKITRLRPPDRTPPGPGSLNSGQAEAAKTPPLAKSIRRVQPRLAERLVALTFDLCERADQISGYDGAIVDVLRGERAPATFFAGGKWMRTHAERTMQLMADPLFEVGNHGWSHGNLRVLTGAKAEDQIAWAQQQYALLRDTLARRAGNAGVPQSEIACIPEMPSLFRFPYGVCSPESLQTAAKLGLWSIQWDVISGDASRGAKPQQLVQTVLAGVRPGSIVVFHANGNGHGTAAALPEIIRRLRDEGYRFVTVSELLRSGDPIATDDCYEMRPGDNKRYDTLFGEGTG